MCVGKTIKAKSKEIIVVNIEHLEVLNKKKL